MNAVIPESHRMIVGNAVVVKGSRVECVYNGKARSMTVEGFGASPTPWIRGKDHSVDGYRTFSVCKMEMVAVS